MEVTITDIEVNNNDKCCFIIKNNTKLIKIGYINDKSKMCNENLKVYTDNIEKLVYIIIVLMIYPKDYYSCESINKQLMGIFMNL